VVADRRADMWWCQVPQPLFHGNRTYHDVRDGISFVKDRESLVQRGAIFDLGISEGPVSGVSESYFRHMPAKETLLDLKPVGRYNGCLWK
jgi:hypothetical protein